MDRNRKQTSTFLARLARGLGKKRHPRDNQLLTSLTSPAPKTSPSKTSYVASFDRTLTYLSPFVVFELPNELFLSILSYISPEPRLAGHYARFRVQYCMQINDVHYLRAQLLRPLNMTCKAMRLRLWTWDLIEPSRRRCVPLHMMRTIANALMLYAQTHLLLPV